MKLAPGLLRKAESPAVPFERENEGIDPPPDGGVNERAEELPLLLPPPKERVTDGDLLLSPPNERVTAGGLLLGRGEERKLDPPPWLGLNEVPLLTRELPLSPLGLRSSEPRSKERVPPSGRLNERDPPDGGTNERGLPASPALGGVNVRFVSGLMLGGLPFGPLGGLKLRTRSELPPERVDGPPLGPPDPALFRSDIALRAFSMAFCKLSACPLGALFVVPGTLPGRLMERGIPLLLSLPTPFEPPGLLEPPGLKPSPFPLRARSICDRSSFERSN